LYFHLAAAHLLVILGSKSVRNLVQFKLFLRTGASLTIVKMSFSGSCPLKIRLHHHALRGENEIGRQRNSM